MNVVPFGHFLLMLLIAGVILRVLESKFSDTAFGEALAFIY